MAYHFIQLYFCVLFCVVTGDLLVSPAKKCGSKICTLTQYCSEYEKICKSCGDICERRNHNYDEHLCNADCQEYLHDIRYVRKDGGGLDSSDLRAEIQTLRTLLTISFTITIILLILFLISAAIFIWKWKKENHITIATLRRKFCPCKKADSNANETAPKISGGKPDLRLEIPSPISGSEMSPVTLTTSISRRPAEDNILDYAYDNHAMSNSPQHRNSRF